jgi:hypothetical protein
VLVLQGQQAGGGAGAGATVRGGDAAELLDRLGCGVKILSGGCEKEMSVTA